MTETTIDDLCAMEEIRRLKATYFRSIDLKQWTTLATVFTATATFEGFWSRAENPTKFVANLTRNLTAEVVSVHQGYMPELTRTSPTEYRGVWGMHDYLTWPPGERAYLGVTLPEQIGVRGYGYYEDVYEQTDCGWKIGFTRLVRLRIDPIIRSGPQIDYPFVQPHGDWLETN